MPEGEYRCGFAAIVGRPNVGKSTLLNTLLDEKISIVTPKPQTTRHRILGIKTGAEAQILFIDTPGLHRNAPRAINQCMNRAATASLAEADVVLLLIEALQWRAEDQDVLERVRQSGAPTLLLVNKVDEIHPRELLLPFLDEVAGKANFCEIIPVSALRGENLERLPELVIARLPASPPLFPEDRITDRSEQFLIAEVIREKLMWQLRQELPYGLTVAVERYAEDAGGLSVGAVIWVERPAQKPIVIGRGGRRLKEVGRAARRELKAKIDRPVHLELWVKVKENWSNSERALRSLGYEIP